MDFQLPCIIGRFGHPGLTFLCDNCGLELRSGGLLWGAHVFSVYCSLHHTLLPWFSNLSVRENHLLVKTQTARLHPSFYFSGSGVSLSFAFLTSSWVMLVLGRTLSTPALHHPVLNLTICYHISAHLACCFPVG